MPGLSIIYVRNACVDPAAFCLERRAGVEDVLRYFLSSF